MHRFLARILAFPIPTIAAMNGHAFAGGAMMTLAHDFRVMRSDRGYFCLPEVDISIPFTVPLSEIIRQKLSPQVAHRAMLTGKRFSAEEALACGIVDEHAPEADVLPKAIALAQDLAPKGRSTLGAIKRNAFSGLLGLLEA
jgi:enoyl-CoA hydratase/carnithine racemase